LVSKLSEISELFIPDLDPVFLPILDPGVNMAPDPGSGSATLVYTQAHSRVHDPAEEAVLACQAEACTYTCRSNAVMKNHVLKAHVKRGPSYACHLCDKLYNREGQLSFSVQQEGQLSFSSQVLLYNRKDS
jgi:hypothetical protein